MKDWTFETSEIANTFDSHVREQLPWYDMATDAVAYIIKNYLQRGGVVVDIGASTGNIAAKILPLVTERDASIVAVDSSYPMVTQLWKRFVEHKNITVIAEDITQIDIPEANVYVLFLTLMFIKTEDRNKLLFDLRSKLKDGGAIIIVDKVADDYGYFSTVLKRLTMHWKLAQGAKPEDVLIKEMSLAGVQIPITEELIPDGKLFFRMGEFAGWVID
jgi:tRNA (cmo5U34)-methyltransferase